MVFCLSAAVHVLFVVVESDVVPLGWGERWVCREYYAVIGWAPGDRCLAVVSGSGEGLAFMIFAYSASVGTKGEDEALSGARRGVCRVRWGLKTLTCLLQGWPDPFGNGARGGSGGRA